MYDSNKQVLLRILGRALVGILGLVFGGVVFAMIVTMIIGGMF